MLEDYEKMNNVPAPAIHRTDFTSTALQLKGMVNQMPGLSHNKVCKLKHPIPSFIMNLLVAMGIQDICGFGFMDPPKKDLVNHALHRLKNLGAIDRLSRITVLGCQVSPC